MTPVVTTSAGALAGRRVVGDVCAYLGIPYAAAPVGDHRFAAPRPASAWLGTRPATHHGAAPPQTAAPSPRPLLDLSAPNQDEDCLTVSVWTPSPAPAARLPVMVWIYGGAYVTGAASLPAYDGARLAARGVVVVSVNYRLGLLGWLRCPALGASGNQGLADQFAALTWVQREIAAFGGDADNVTVFGESAGAGSIAAHLAGRGERPFARAVLQSGAHNLIKTEAAADDAAARVLGALGGDAARLRTMTTAEVLTTQDTATPRSGGVFYGPVADGDLVPTEPGRVLAGGHSAVPVLVGTNRDEMGFFWGRDERFDVVTDDALPVMVARWHADPTLVITTYREARARRGAPTDARSILVAIGSDATFRAGAMAIAGWQPRAHAYRFDHETPRYPGLVGAGHVLEVPFVFGTYDHQSVAAFTGHDVDAKGVAALSNEVASAWVAFATTGDPGWPRYTTDRRATRCFGSSPGVRHDPDGDERAVWDPFTLP